MEPVSAHGLVPVTRDFHQATGVRGTRRTRVRSSGVDGVAPGEDDWIVVIVELIRKEEGAGKAVVLRSVMAVVFVSGDCMNAETSVLILENGKFVVETEEDWFAVTYLHELGRNASVVSPELVSVLVRQVRVKPRWKRSRRVDAGILGRRNTRIVSVIDLSPFH